MSFNVRDAQLEVSRALPNGAGNATSAASIDTGVRSAAGRLIAGCELEIDAPALTTGELPNAATMTYDVVASDNADLSSPTIVASGWLVQTGAGGVGAAAAKKRWRPPTDSKRYYGLKATNSGAGNASGKTAYLRLLV